MVVHSYTLANAIEFPLSLIWEDLPLLVSVELYLQSTDHRRPGVGRSRAGSIALATTVIETYLVAPRNEREWNGADLHLPIAIG